MTRVFRRASHRLLGATALTLSMAIAMPSAPAQAQDDGLQEGGFTLPTIDITGTTEFIDTSSGPVQGWYAPSADSATRTRTPLRQVPQSIQVLPRQFIEEQGAQSVGDVLRNVPGAVVSQDSEVFLTTPILRGFEARTFFDGQPSFSFSNSADPLSTIQVERVEIIKGPSGALFGGGVGAPLGGIINIVRKRPEADEVFGSAEIDAGSFGNVGFAGDINVPLAWDGGVRFRMQAGFRKEDGFIDDAESEQVNVFPALEADLGEDTTLRLMGFYGRRDFVEYPGLPPTAVTFPNFDERQFPGSLTPPESRNETAYAQAFLDHNIFDNLSVHGSFQYLIDDFVENDSFADGNFFDLDPTDTVYPVITGQLTNDVAQITANAWANAQFTTGPATHDLLFGFEADDTDYDATTTFQPTGDAIDLLNPVRPAFTPLSIPPGTVAAIDAHSYSVYAQNQISLWDRLHLLGSLRWTRLETDDQSISLGTSIETTFTELTPRVGVAVDVTDAITVFAGYGEGFEQVLFFNPSTPGDSPEPETSEQYEVGVKFQTGYGLSGSVALFEITRENVPVVASTPGNPFGQIQSGEQRARGLEIEALWQPNPALSILGAYTLQSAEVTEDTSFPVGDDLIRVPTQFGRVAAHYRFLQGDLKGLSIGGGVTASTGSEITLPNSFETDGYVTVDLRVGYKIGQAELALSVENLFDEDYFVPYGFFASTVTPGDPRTVLASVRMNF